MALAQRYPGLIESQSQMTLLGLRLYFQDGESVSSLYLNAAPPQMISI
jgi:hypothetical protein